MKLVISNKIGDKLKADLKLKRVFEDAWNPMIFNNTIFISVKRSSLFL